jgi:ADP-ribose diphosphatase
MRQKPQVVQSKVVARTRFFCVEERELLFSNGTQVIHERLVGGPNGAVLIVPMRDDDTVMLIREYATGVHRYELALPKGRIEDNEPLLAAANREIMEEIGYGANKLTPLRSMTIAPGYQGSVTHVVLAQDLYEQRCEGDEPEEIEVIPWPLSRLNDLLAHEECTEARSIAALFLARDFLANNP